MNLDDSQKRQVAAWLDEGLKLSDIQRKLESEFKLRLTYMEVRFLVDDLKVLPKDPEPAPTPAPAQPTLAPSQGASQPGPGAGPQQPPTLTPLPDDAGLPGSGVKVTVDQLARPGALVSGKVTFSDGKTAEWHLDQMGRLGIVPPEPGYKPLPADVQDFQYELQAQLAKLGL